MTFIHQSNPFELSEDRIQLTGLTVTDSHRPVVFPGSLNPLHEGHLRMAVIAQRVLGKAVDFELSMANVDKPDLEIEEVMRRADQFLENRLKARLGDPVLWMTHAPTFAEKAAVFPGATFVVGADTALRLVDPRYYDGDARRLATALERLKSHGCGFLVFGRLVEDTYQDLDALDLPNDWREVCRGMSEETFRMDISSSELRDD